MSAARRRVAFFGSPAFALPVLEAILQQHEVVLVVSQPDKPVGRGMKLTPPPVAARATELGVLLAQPTRLRGNSVFRQQLADSGAEVAVTCAYGKLLTAELLTVPRFGFLNTHTSLLPKYRGAAPIQWALINGEKQTGTTIMQTDVGMDTGPILLQEALTIAPEWDSNQLADALAQQAASLIVEALNRLEQLIPQPQDHTTASHAPMLSKEDGFVRWTDSAEQVVSRYKGVAAWPQTTAFCRDQRLKLQSLSVAEIDSIAQPETKQSVVQAGQILAISEKGLVVACGRGAVCVSSVQPAARKAQSAQAWAKAAGLTVGDLLS